MVSRSLGVDIGGTDIKFGIVENGKIIVKKKIPTLYINQTEELVEYIADECKKIVDEYSIDKMGVGVPGDVKNNVVVKSGNLPFENLPLSDMISEKIGFRVNIENDANCAALGELRFGEGKNHNDFVMLTIGTGIGGCIIINKEIYKGSGYAGELGHMILEKGGIPCSCGQNGCFEQYASTSALVKEAVRSANNDKNSTLYRLFAQNGEKMNGKILFKALSDNCIIAQNVFNKYADYLAEGLNSIIKVFDPEIVILSGGITKEGDAFLKPITDKMQKSGVVKISVLQDDAGVLGASLV